MESTVITFVVISIVFLSIVLFIFHKFLDTFSWSRRLEPPCLEEAPIEEVLFAIRTLANNIRSEKETDKIAELRIAELVKDLKELHPNINAENIEESWLSLSRLSVPYQIMVRDYNRLLRSGAISEEQYKERIEPTRIIYRKTQTAVHKLTELKAKRSKKH